jgi:hypothetical protein
VLGFGEKGIGDLFADLGPHATRGTLEDLNHIFPKRIAAALPKIQGRVCV